MKVHKVKISGTQYNVAEPSAENQLKLTSMVGAMALIELAKTGKAIDKHMIVGSLLTVQHDKLVEIAELVTYKTFINGKDQPVDIKDFQGKMCDYLQLIAESIILSLSDFFDYLSSEIKTEDAGQ